MAQAGGDEWPGEVKVNLLEGALNEEMQSCFISYPLPDDIYSTFRAPCFSIDAKIRALLMRLLTDQLMLITTEQVQTNTVNYLNLGKEGGEHFYLINTSFGSAFIRTQSSVLSRDEFSVPSVN